MKVTAARLARRSHSLYVVGVGGEAGDGAAQVVDELVRGPVRGALVDGRRRPGGSGRCRGRSASVRRIDVGQLLGEVAQVGIDRHEARRRRAAARSRTSAAVSPYGRRPRTRWWSRPSSTYWLASISTSKSSAAADRATRRSSCSRALSRCRRAAVEVVLGVLGAAQPHEQRALLIERRRLLERSTQHPDGDRDSSPDSSATRPWSARNAETRSSPEPGEATRCWATVPGGSPSAHSSRAARACSSPTATSRHACLDCPPDQRMHELDRVAVPHDAGRLEPRRLTNRLGRGDPGELGDDRERAAVAENRSGLGDQRGLGPQLAEPGGARSVATTGCPGRAWQVRHRAPCLGTDASARAGRRRCRRTRAGTRRRRRRRPTAPARRPPARPPRRA